MRRKVIFSAVFGVCLFSITAWGQVTEEWVARYDGPFTSGDTATALAVDNSGNVYVTGYSYTPGSYYDYATVKYAPNGDTLWVRRFNGSGNSDDRAYALAVDISGNVYVTGYSYINAVSVLDYATIKYDPNGNTMWVRYYDVGSGDKAYAIIVDTDGYVYVTGQSYMSGSNYDYATIKYNPSNGDSLWVRRYNGPGNNYEEANAIAVDNNGYVYVTGLSYGSGSLQDFATIKYAPNGDTLWVRRYNGPGNDYDYANDLAVDTGGNVYVTGACTGSGSSQDYATIKYKPNGDTAWVRHYDVDNSDVPYAIAVDNSGYVYVTGGSWGGASTYDYATIKYKPNGDTLWVRRFNGPGNGGNYWDLANALAIDNGGNVYVTGRSMGSMGTGFDNTFDYATIKYAPNGDSLWVRRYDGPGNSADRAYALAVDDSGNVYVTGFSYGSGSYSDYATIKYAPNGATVWVGRYNGPGMSDDRASALAVDGSGNVYVTGWSPGNNIFRDTDFDYVTIKYNPNGDTLWVRRYNGPGDSTDQASAITVGNNGNVYVTGRSTSTSFGKPSNYATIKYAPNGDTVWVRRYDGPGDLNDSASAIAVDNNGKVYVTGVSSSLFNQADYATIKYFPNGDTVWVRRYNGTGNAEDLASAIAVDNSGNVYVTGWSIGSGSFRDYATIKYDPIGNVQWVGRYNGPDNTDDEATALTVDDSGYVYVTGRSNVGGFEQYDYATIKYAPNGDTVWVRRYNGPGNSVDEAYALAVNNNGNLYVTGNSLGSGSSRDYATIKYAPNGDSLWVKRYNGPGNSVDYAEALAVDSNSNVYVTGWSAAGGGALIDYATIKYAPNGDSLWVKRYNGPANATDFVTALAVDNNDDVYVTGFSDGGGSSYDFATIRYAQSSSPLLIIQAFSPVDLIVTDPTGDSIGISFNTIADGSTYTLSNDSVFIPLVENGEYVIRVVRDTLDVSGDTSYSVEVVVGGDQAALASNAPVPGIGEVHNYEITAGTPTPGCLSEPGDANADGAQTLSDIISIVNFIFNKAGCLPAPNCWFKGLNCRGDWDGSTTVTLADAIRGVNDLFNKPGGPWDALPVGVCCLP